MKVLVNILLIAVFPLFGSGQITFKKTFGTNGFDTGSDIVQLEDSSYVVLGTTGKFGGTGGEVYLFKIDSVANFIWSQAIGGQNVENGKELVVTADSGFAIIGYTNSYGNGGYDCYLIKTDIDGNVLWEKTFGGADWDFGYSIDETLDSGFIIVGESYSFGTGNSELYVIKTDASGNLEWEETFPATGDAAGLSVVSLSTNEYLIGGYGENSTDKDGWLMKLDAAGNVLRSTTYGTPGGDDEITSVRSFYNGNYLFAGNTTTLSSYGNADIMLWSVTPNFDSVFAQFYGGPDEDLVYDVTSHPANGWTYITGGTKSFGTSDGFHDVYVYQINNGGWWMSGISFGFARDDIGRSVLYASDGGWCMAGHTTEGGYGGSDAWVVKYDSLNDTLNSGQAYYQDVTSTPTISHEYPAIHVYPNPANERIGFIGLTSQATVVAYDNLGRIVKRTTVQPGQKIDVQGFDQGVYIVELEIDQVGLLRQQFIITR